MARHKEFDNEQAIDVAIEVFREKGFAGSTTEDLRLAMGIGRQSFYDTFKGKRELYRMALSRYGEKRASEFRSEAKENKSELKAIEGFLVSVIKDSLENPQLACLGVYSICEFGTADEDISAINSRSSLRYLESLKTLIEMGQIKKVIRKELKSSETAEYLLTMALGLKLSAHGGASELALKRIVNFTVSSLKA